MLFKPKNHFSYSFSFHFLILLLFFLSFTFEISTEKNSIYLREIEIVKKSKGECPENFVYSKEYSSCVLKCVPVLPQDYKYENVYRIIQIVCGTLSFICCAIYCIYSVLRYEILLRFPASNIFWIFISLWVLSISLIVPGYFGFEDYFCLNESTSIDARSFRCLFQAIVGTVPTMWSILWWTFYNFTMMLLLRGFKLKGLRIFAIVSWLIIMIYPLIAMIIFISLDKVTVSSLGCNVDISGVVYGMYVIPILFGTVFANTIIITIVSISVCSKYAKKKQFKYIIIKQYRLIFLYVYYIFIIVISIYFFITFLLYSDEWSNNYQDYIDCVLDKWDNNEDYKTLCDDNIVYHTPHPITIISILLTSSLGIFFFFILVLRRAVFDWWKNYFVNCWTKKTLYPPSSFLRSQNI